MPPLDFAAAPTAISGAKYITRDTNLRISSWNSAAGVTLAVIVRQLDARGVVVRNLFDHVPLTTRAIAQTTHALQEGWLLSVQVIASAGTVRRGQCFVRVELIEGLSGALTSLDTLVQNYAQSAHALAWPGSPLLSSVDGPGLPRTIAGTNVAANTDLLETVPTGARWRLKSFNATFVAGAGVANRTIFFAIDDGVNSIWVGGSGVIVTASQTVAFHLGAGVPFHTLAALNYMIPLPIGLLLLAGSRLATLTISIQAADDWSAPTYHVEEWIDV